MVVTSSALYSGVWQTFFDAIDDNVAHPTTPGTKFVYSSFPDTIKTTTTSYPVIVVNRARVKRDTEITLGEGIVIVGMTLSIDIYTTNAAQCDSLSNSVYDCIDTRRETVFTVADIKQLKSAGSIPSEVMRGGMKVHVNTLIWEFTFQH